VFSKACCVRTRHQGIAKIIAFRQTQGETSLRVVRANEKVV
jgi:hypothetical protein